MSYLYRGVSSSFKKRRGAVFILLAFCLIWFLSLTLGWANPGKNNGGVVLEVSHSDNQSNNGKNDVSDQERKDKDSSSTSTNLNENDELPAFEEEPLNSPRYDGAAQGDEIQEPESNPTPFSAQEDNSLEENKDQKDIDFQKDLVRTVENGVATTRTFESRTAQSYSGGGYASISLEKTASASIGDTFNITKEALPEHQYLCVGEEGTVIYNISVAHTSGDGYTVTGKLKIHNDPNQSGVTAQIQDWDDFITYRVSGNWYTLAYDTFSVNPPIPSEIPPSNDWYEFDYVGTFQLPPGVSPSDIQTIKNTFQVTLSNASPNKKGPYETHQAFSLPSTSNGTDTVEVSDVESVHPSTGLPFKVTDVVVDGTPSSDLTGPWELTVPSDTTKTIQITKKVTGEAVGTYTLEDTATIVSTDKYDTEEVSITVIFPNIELKKYVSVDNQTTWQDANSPPGPTAVPGEDVYFKLVVTNTGNTTLTNINLSDTDFDVSSISVVDPLTPGNSFEGIIGPYSAINGQHADTATVNAQTPCQKDVSDSDPAYYYGKEEPSPSVDIEKHTNGEDADTPTGPYIPVGDSVTWEYAVTNTGNVTLTALSVEDSVLGPIGSLLSELSPGETTTFLANGTATAGQYENTATVTAWFCPYETNYDLQPPASVDQVPADGGCNLLIDSDPSHYYGIELASIGNFIWEDIDGDGVQDTGEPGVKNVSAKLYDDGDNLIASTNTDANGYYYFNNLWPGDYYLVYKAPAGYYFTSQNSGSDKEKDSDANPSTGQTVKTTLDPGENDTSWDAGLYRLASLGDFFWEDLDTDGIQDPGEPGIPNTAVNLNDKNGNLIDQTLTNGNGYYSFNDLVPGQYSVKFIIPNDYEFYEFVDQDQGADDSRDSDANPANGKASLTQLESGEKDLTWDAGIGEFVLPYTPEKKKKVTAEIPEALPYTGLELWKYLSLLPFILLLLIIGLILQREKPMVRKTSKLNQK